MGVWLAENREIMKAKMSSSSKIHEVEKQLPAVWKALPEESKRTYHEKFNAMPSDYQNAVRNFIRHISRRLYVRGGQKNAVRKTPKSARAALKNSTQKRRREGKVRMPSYGAYGVWLSEHREEIKRSLPTGCSVTEVAKKRKSCGRGCLKRRSRSSNPNFRRS